VADRGWGRGGVFGLEEEEGEVRQGDDHCCL
jgi:hypothetical protein